jgi:hypothetical protein
MTRTATATHATAAVGRGVAILAACVLALGLTACKKGEEAAEGAKAPEVLTAPAGNDDTAWRNYLGKVVAAHQEGVTDRVYAYYIPANSQVAAEDGSSQYGRQLDNVSSVVARTVLPGNMLAFGSPDSTAMGDLIVAAFKDAKPDALKSSQVLFIGKAEDRDRVKAAVEAAGAKFVFIEAK